MKKALIIALSMMMALSMSVPAFAQSGASYPRGSLPLHWDIAANRQ